MLCSGRVVGKDSWGDHQSWWFWCFSQELGVKLATCSSYFVFSWEDLVNLGGRAGLPSLLRPHFHEFWWVGVSLVYPRYKKSSNLESCDISFLGESGLPLWSFLLSWLRWKEHHGNSFWGKKSSQYFSATKFTLLCFPLEDCVLFLQEFGLERWEF